MRGAPDDAVDASKPLICSPGSVEEPVWGGCEAAKAELPILARPPCIRAEMLR